MLKINLCMTVLALSLVTSSAFALTIKEDEVVNKIREVTLVEARLQGQPSVILADANGISLYTFDSDSPGHSACKDSCLTSWPPLHVAANTELPAPFGRITGNDGKPQLTLKGLPLYFYFKDKKPGDTFGDYPKWHPVLVKK